MYVYTFMAEYTYTYIYNRTTAYPSHEKGHINNKEVKKENICIKCF